MESMGCNKLIASIFCLLFSALYTTQVNCQNAVDNSPATIKLVKDLEQELLKLQPDFSKVQIAIPLPTDDFSAEFIWEDGQVSISRSFLYWALDTLNIIPLKMMDTKEDHLDYKNLTNDQIEIPLLGVLCHEFGHYLQQYYHDTLFNTLGNIDPILKQQQVEYTCDFVSGFMSGKSRWMRIRDLLFKDCGGGSQTNIVQLILSVYLNQEPPLNDAFNCLEKYVGPYRNADLLIRFGGDCEHGLGQFRKNAFDAGLFYSIFDGIARETFEDKEVLRQIQDTIKWFGISIDQLKSQFAGNLKNYLVRKKGLNSAVDIVLKTYSAEQLYVAAFKYCLNLNRNQQPECHIDLSR